MDTFDPAAGEFLRISERYRQMSDGELLVLIPQSSELTPFAQEALANEVRSRGLKAEVEDENQQVRRLSRRQLSLSTNLSTDLRNSAIRSVTIIPAPILQARTSTTKTANWLSSAPYGACATRSRHRRFLMRREFRFSWDQRKLLPWTG